MKYRCAMIFLGLLATAPSFALAHDASLHKGKATMGEVTSVSGEKLVMQTDQGPVDVTLTRETHFETGEGHAGTKADLKVGDHVMVTGTKLASGELVAKEVMVHDGKSEAGPVAYTCKMHPEVASEKPGKCPKCGMDLVRKE